MPENPIVAFAIFGGQVLIFLPVSVFAVHKTLQTRGERSTWEEGKQRVGVALMFCGLEVWIYISTSLLLKEDLLGGRAAAGALPTWGWALLVQGVLFGLASGAVAWYRNCSRGAWFLAGVLFGPFGLVATMATTQGEKETTEPESEGSGLCPNCGAHVHWGTGICTECGYAFDGGAVDENNDGIPVYTSEGKVAELTGISRVLLLLLITALAVGVLWLYYAGARAGYDLYLLFALLGSILGVASLGGWYGLLVGPIGGGCRERFLLIAGIFLILSVAPVWFHLSDSPSITVEDTTARVARTVPPVCMELDYLLRMTGTGTLGHTADALGRAVYEAASARDGSVRRVIVRLEVVCRSGRHRSIPDFVARDTIRDVGEVRAFAGAAAYAASDHWTTMSQPRFVPDQPCNGRTYGFVEDFVILAYAFLLLAWRSIETFWWAVRTGRWGIVAVGVGILLWIYWKARKGSRQDGANNA